MLDSYPIASNLLEIIYGHVDGEQLGRQYKEYLSDFNRWTAKAHAHEWLVFPENTGEYLSIDETSVSRGELYTIVTNKSAHGGKGTIVAIVSGTEASEVIAALERIPEELRAKVKEVTLDMSDSMRKIVRSCFPKASRVIDRFHVQNLAYDAIQEMRIAHRWDAMLRQAQQPSMKKQTHWKRLNYPATNISLKYLKTEIQKNNYWQEVAIYCSNLPKNGQKDKNKEPKYFSNFIQTSKKHTV